MGSLIVCPHCGQPIELTEAFRSEVEEGIKAQLEKQWQSQLAQKDQKIKTMVDQEIKLREEKRLLEEKEKDIDLVISRKVDEQRKQTEEATLKRAVESFHLKEAEKDKIISDLKTALEDAQRKATQSSQQLQGEVLELDLEKILQDTFRDDDIQAIGKGVLGADIRQIVKTPRGTVCGTILWESKRTKAWGGDWVPKLKQDMLRDKADLAAIVSEVLPENYDLLGQLEGIHLCSPRTVIPLTFLLRKILIDVMRQKKVAEGQQDKAGRLYTYVTSNEFRQQMESIVEVYTEMQDQLNQERTAYQKMWKRREAQIVRLLDGVGGIYGYLQGVAGPSLAPVHGLELPEPRETS
jgi:hypothetical protein